MSKVVHMKVGKSELDFANVVSQFGKAPTKEVQA